MNDSANFPPSDPSDLTQLADRLPLDDCIALLSGKDYWSLPDLPGQGIGRLSMTDGPNGARGGGSLFGGLSSACFPCGSALGCSWDPDLVKDVAAAIAEEVRTKDAHVALAPTINIQRTPLNGRNFECHSEDPVLAAAIAVAFVRGLQSRGVAATPKHFAGNESEIARTTIDTRADERTLREVYLRPFEAAVRDGGAWAIMSAYNRVNGTYAAENHWLLTQVLRDEWGFDGAVISDWFGSRSTVPTVAAGLDIEMPGPTRDRGAKLRAAVDNGEISEAQVRDLTRNVLRLVSRTGAAHSAATRVETARVKPEHSRLARKAAVDCAVLLKNDNSLLPLRSKDAGQIAVIGPNAKLAPIMGGGSAQLTPHYVSDPWDALADSLGTDRLSYAQGSSNHRWEPLIEDAFKIEYYTTPDFSGDAVFVEHISESRVFWVEPVAEGRVDPMRFSARLTGSIAIASPGRYHFGIHVAGHARVILDGKLIVDLGPDHWRKGRTFFEEGCDEIVVVLDFDTPRTAHLEIEYATKTPDNLDVAALRFGMSRVADKDPVAVAADIAGDAEIALLFVGRNGEWDTEGSDLVDIALPGDQDRLISAVAAACDKTVVILQSGGPVAMPWATEVSAIIQAHYPGQEYGRAITDILLGKAEPAGRLAQTYPADLAQTVARNEGPAAYPGDGTRVLYNEGVFVGYKYAMKHGTMPLFPFGHGLSYTDFSLSGLGLSQDAHDVTAVVDVRNTGKRSGSSVVQLYQCPPQSDQRPQMSLIGFQKALLAPGETRRLTIKVPIRELAWFDATERQWRVDAGTHRFRAGFSSADLRAEACLEMEARAMAPDFWPVRM